MSLCPFHVVVRKTYGSKMLFDVIIIISYLFIDIIIDILCVMYYIISIFMSLMIGE